jgi:FkbM family methyltransferase
MFHSAYDDFVYCHNDPIFHHSIQNGQSEPYQRDLAIVAKYVKMFPHKNRGYIDVGAHIGTTVMPYLRMFQTAIAYEPQKDNFEFLTQNIERNGMKDRCVIKNLACSNEERKGTIVPHEGGNSGCYKFVESEKEGTDTKTIRLDDDTGCEFPVDFLKIDTEGHELFVLKGAERTLLRWKPLIQFEANGLSEKHFGVRANDIYQYLYSLGAREWDTSDPANVFFYFPNISLSIEPRTIYCFWFGKEPMSAQRKECLETIPIHQRRLITEENFHEWILQSEPLHPAFPFLSATHKSDYMRTYFMNFYGGGYTDVKRQTGSWDSAFEIMTTGNFNGCGYREEHPHHIAHPDFTQYFHDLIGNGAYIFKPYTDLTRDWYGQMKAYLDTIYPILKDHPATEPQDSLEKGRGYPIGWNHMLGRIFHPIIYRYHKTIFYDVPQPSFLNYR